MSALAGVIVIGLALTWILKKYVVLPGRNLRSKFQAAGTLKGRTKSEIIGKVGAPQSTASYPDGTSLLQWQATGYHICLGFDQNNVCLGVQSEYIDRDISSGILGSTPSSSESPVTSPTQPEVGVEPQPPNRIRMPTAFCQNCGARVSSSAQYCGDCGTRLRRTE